MTGDNIIPVGGRHFLREHPFFLFYEPVSFSSA